MKNLFKVNLKTKEHGYDEFLVRKSDRGLKARYDNNSKLFDKTLKKKFAFPFYIGTAALFIGAIFICIFKGAAEKAENNFSQAYEAMGWAMYLGIAGIVLFIVLFAWAVVGLRRFMRYPQTQNFLTEQSELERKIAQDLLVPEDCKQIDILGQPYKISQGREKGVRKNYFENLPMTVFADVSNLYLADTSGVWAIPLSGITEIIPLRGRTTLSGWNKSDKVTDKKYRKIVRVYKGKFYLKSRYSVHFTYNGELWEILIPAYDIEVMSEITGIFP